MPEQRSSRAMVFAFEGRYSDEALQRADISSERLLDGFQRQKSAIESELSEELERRLSAESVALDIEFVEGSVDWVGHVHLVYQVMEVFANIGGAIGLCQLVGAAISRVLRRHTPKQLPSPYTRVVLVHAPPSKPDSADPRLDFPSRRFMMYLLLIVVMTNYLATVLGFLWVFWRLSAR
jgi:hypothetical protein